MYILQELLQRQESMHLESIADSFADPQLLYLNYIHLLFTSASSIVKF